MMEYVLLQAGIERIRDLMLEMTYRLEEREYESVAQMQGSMSQQHVADPTKFERSNYMKTLQSFRPQPS